MGGVKWKLWRKEEEKEMKIRKKEMKTDLAIDRGREG